MNVERQSSVAILYKVIENYQRRKQSLERRESKIRDRITRLSERVRSSQSLVAVQPQSGIGKATHSNYGKDAESGAINPKYNRSKGLREQNQHIVQSEQLDNTFSSLRGRESRRARFSYRQCDKRCGSGVDSDSETQILNSETKRFQKRNTRLSFKKSQSITPDLSKRYVEGRGPSSREQSSRGNFDRTRCSDDRRLVNRKENPHTLRGDQLAPQRNVPMVTTKRSFTERFSFSSETGRQSDSEFSFSQSGFEYATSSNCSFTRRDSVSFFEKREEVPSSLKKQRKIKERVDTRHHPGLNDRNQRKCAGLMSKDVKKVTRKESSIKICPDCNLLDIPDDYFSKRNHKPKCVSFHPEWPSRANKKHKRDCGFRSKFVERDRDNSEECSQCGEYETSRCYQDVDVEKQNQIHSRTHSGSFHTKRNGHADYMPSVKSPCEKDFKEEYSNTFLCYLIKKCIPMSQLLSLPTDVMAWTIEKTQTMLAKIDEIRSIKTIMCEELEFREHIGNPYMLRREDKELLMMNIVFANAVRDGLAKGQCMGEIISQFHQSSTAGSIDEQALEAIRKATKVLPLNRERLEAIAQAAAQCHNTRNEDMSGRKSNTPDLERLGTIFSDLKTERPKTSPGEFLAQNYEQMKNLLEKKTRDAYMETMEVKNEVGMLEQEIEGIRRQMESISSNRTQGIEQKNDKTEVAGSHVIGK